MRKVWLMLLLLPPIMLPLRADAEREDDEGPVETEEFSLSPETGDGMPYEVTIDGTNTQAILNLAAEVVTTITKADAPPEDLVILRSRAESDITLLEQAMRSRGFFENSIDLDFDEDARPVAINFTITPGPAYRYQDVTIELAGDADSDYVVPTPAELGLSDGTIGESRRALDAETQLLEDAQHFGFAWAEIKPRTAYLDPETKALEVILRIDPGPKAVLGGLLANEFGSVDDSYITELVTWEPELDIYTPGLLEDFRDELADTRLFSSIRLTLDDPDVRSGEVVTPVLLETTEAKHRTLGAGVRFQTDSGLGGNLFWEHRNFLGRGERFRIEADASKLKQELSASFRRPSFLREDQQLVFQGAFRHEETDAFDSTSFGLSGGVEREIREGMNLSVGLALRGVEIVENDGNFTNFALISAPVRFDWDFSNNLLDPSEGGRLRISGAPFWDTVDTSLSFLKARISYRHYYQVSESPWLVLAGRAAFGTITGASRDSIPADERFFSGGGGSVRGYRFQFAGQLDQNNEPVGGASFLESSVELRARVSESIGVVGFVDAGSAFEAETYDASEELFFGAGVGLRYLTPIGPFRADIAFPLDKRDVDDDFQFYISLGQAF